MTKHKEQTGRAYLMGRITTRSRQNDWIAFITNDEPQWDSGASEADAIGRLIQHRGYFVLTPEERRKATPQPGQWACNCPPPGNQRSCPGLCPTCGCFPTSSENTARRQAELEAGIRSGRIK